MDDLTNTHVVCHTVDCCVFLTAMNFIEKYPKGISSYEEKMTFLSIGSYKTQGKSNLECIVVRCRK